MDGLTSTPCTGIAMGFVGGKDFVLTVQPIYTARYFKDRCDCEGQMLAIVWIVKKMTKISNEHIINWVSVLDLFIHD